MNGKLIFGACDGIQSDACDRRARVVSVLLVRALRLRHRQFTLGTCKKHFNSLRNQTSQNEGRIEAAWRYQTLPVRKVNLEVIPVQRSSSAMLPQLIAPSIRISVEPLNQSTFSQFGTVIENPEHNPSSGVTNYNVVKANQGSALKYIDVSHLTSHYHSAPSSKPAKAVVNMFVCSPRELKVLSQPGDPTLRNTVNIGQQAFPVHILERHPFTPQTFIPTGLSVEDTSTAYLVIVAPTRPTSSGTPVDRPPPYPQQAPRRRHSITDLFSKARPSLFIDTKESPRPNLPPTPGQPKGTGEPDLTQIRAFIATGYQSVTYGPGTWHAPMVVLGAKSVDFVVVQYANGVALEDCQEMEIKNELGSEGLNVIVSDEVFGPTIKDKAKL